ncbi:MAG: prolyl oligopeptidase family serine peptidase [Dehalococcoidia bacterium]
MLPTPDLSHDAPWKRRFRAWTVAGAAVASREPTRGIAITNKTGVYQVYAWDVRTGDLRQLTFKPSGKPTASLSPDGRFVYYLDDEQGNELGHLVRAPFEGGEPIDLTPDLPQYALSATAISRDARTLAFTTATRDGFHTYVCPLSADCDVGERRPLFHTRRLMRGLNLSNDGAVAVLGLTERSGSTDTDLVAIDTATGERIGELYDEGATLAAVRFSRVPGDERLLCSTTRSNNIRPLIWNPRPGERIDYEFPELSGAVSPADWSGDAERVLLMQIDQAVQHLAVYDLGAGALIMLDHPPGTIASAHFAEHDEIFAHIQDSTTPGRLVALDAGTGTQNRVVLTGEDAPPGTPWRSITYSSTAGAQIQAWLATPDGPGPFPTILHMHGGPDAVQTNLFVPSVQAWLDHGFAILDINYRGSVTFGREFQQCIRGDLGHWEVDDIAAAHASLIASGIAKEGQIFLNGGSYGGYLTLMGLGKLPGLFAGGMAIVAIADWTLMFEDQAETLRRYQAALFGGTPDELPEQHAASSPITYASNISAPLLVIQGANDTRCPPRQMKVYEEKLLELGKDVQLRWFEAGHGSYATEQNIEHQELMLQFAYRVLQSQSEAVSV